MRKCGESHFCGLRKALSGRKKSSQRLLGFRTRCDAPGDSAVPPAIPGLCSCCCRQRCWRGTLRPREKLMEEFGRLDPDDDAGGAVVIER